MKTFYMFAMEDGSQATDDVYHSIQEAIKDVNEVCNVYGDDEVKYIVECRAVRRLDRKIVVEPIK